MVFWVTLLETFNACQVEGSGLIVIVMYKNLLVRSWQLQDQTFSSTVKICVNFKISFSTKTMTFIQLQIFMEELE